MELIQPLPASLARTQTSTPTYLYLAWQSGVVYSAGEYVRSNITGVWRDYWALFRHTSASWNAPTLGFLSNVADYGAGIWVDAGPASFSDGYTWATNVRLSRCDKWTTGAIVEGEQRFDESNLHDYRAMIAMTSVENNKRPSSAAASSDPIVRARWLDLGAANAWAALDHTSNSYTIGYSPTGISLSPVVFSIDVTTKTDVDRVCFAGLINVSGVIIKTYLSGSSTPTQTLNRSLVPSGVSYGITYRSLIIPITTVSAGTPLKIEITLTRLVSTQPVQLGVVCAGRGLFLANTEWGVETSLLSFSTKERNETFGTTKFIKRGSAKLVRATCLVDTLEVSGDVIQQLLSDVDGLPIYWDFNAGDAAYDRLRVFGFYSRMSLAISASTWESLSLDIEGLVE